MPWKWIKTQEDHREFLEGAKTVYQILEIDTADNSQWRSYQSEVYRTPTSVKKAIQNRVIPGCIRWCDYNERDEAKRNVRDMLKGWDGDDMWFNIGDRMIILRKLTADDSFDWVTDTAVRHFE